MTALEKLRGWVAAYPGYDILGAFQVDYTDRVPNNGGVFPSGLVEVERRQDIMGSVTVTNQYNFGLYYVFEKAPGTTRERRSSPAGLWTSRSGCRSRASWAWPRPLATNRKRSG